MNEILLQTLIDKMTAFQKQQQEQNEMIKALPDYSPAIEQVNDRMDRIQTEIKTIPGRISLPEEEIINLTKTLSAHTLQLQQPLKSEIRHHHHLTRPLWACFVLAALSLTLIAFLVQARDRIAENKASDIKYRFIRSINLETEQSIASYDSLYETNPDQMEKTVEARERHRQEVLQAEQHAEEAANTLQQLQGSTQEEKQRSGKRKSR
jgi:hypothetical protein